MNVLAAVTDPADRPSASVVYVDPDMAQRWLLRNTKNRKLKRNKIEAYTRDMVAGRWQITGEAIKFDTSGDILDGQNRLTAVVASGQTVPMFVVRGLASAAQEVMDTGAPRTGADALHLRGNVRADKLSAAATAYHAWSTGFFRHAMHQSTIKLTNSEILAAVDKDPGLVDSTAFAVSAYRHLPLPIGSLATAHYVLTGLDADAFAKFFGQIVDLNTSGAGDPMHTLVRRISESRARRERIWVSTGLFYMFRTWKSWRAGQRLHRLSVGSPQRGWSSIPEPR